jgi:hopene-associated glycosyltransferase HpnB
MRARMTATGTQFVSIMARLRMVGFWERLLMPAFVYFFKLLYPFRVANSRFRLVAAAAGGCILMERRVLEAIGGFAPIRTALIDDCALARRVKAHGFATWIGLSHGVVSTRAYPRLADIWAMVARTAFAQLKHSPMLLGLTSLALVLAFWVPVLVLAAPDPGARWLGAAALAAMIASYVPILAYYRRSPFWALALPVIGTLYLAMTWTSAWRYWGGSGAQWKARAYGR